MKKLVWLAVVAAGLLLILRAQVDIRSEIDKSRGKVPMIALPDFKGSGEAQALMASFNQTLWDDVSGSGVVQLVPKTMYCLLYTSDAADE